ncbi:hypothetical protein [Streptomyces thermolilacinus]|uniref:Uncharacterized protein n=1 Tax=Streptomyces thermolilacinus SPC6 TaxID=1306406 RepID=A0A1D3DSK4_9ACTN|nr:hypothetical protein [Streptomyces thermolilacinus]OEJ95300.1 hypothetical protein J116_013255 [Streptomyces thermolilacinus SPC6]
MPRTDARRRGGAVTCGVRGAWGLVLVVLVLCVCPGAAGERSYGEPGSGDRTRAAADVPYAAVSHALYPVAAPAHGDGRPPGCRDDSGTRDGGLAPAAPPRTLTLADLLPAPPDARGGGGCAGWAAFESAATGPERAPLALVPPSPMDLSILRV